MELGSSASLLTDALRRLHYGELRTKHRGPPSLSQGKVVATPHSGGSCKTTSRTLTIATCTQARGKNNRPKQRCNEALAMPGCVYKLIWWLGSQICVFDSLDGSRWCLNTCDSSGVSNHNVEAGQGRINRPSLKTSRWEKAATFLCYHWTVWCV